MNNHKIIILNGFFDIYYFFVCQQGFGYTLQNIKQLIREDLIRDICILHIEAINDPAIGSIIVPVRVISRMNYSSRFYVSGICKSCNEEILSSEILSLLCTLYRIGSYESIHEYYKDSISEEEWHEI